MASKSQETQLMQESIGVSMVGQAFDACRRSCCVIGPSNGGVLQIGITPYKDLIVFDD